MHHHDNRTDALFASIDQALAICAAILKLKGE